MEISVAVVSLRNTFALSKFCPPDKFNVLLVNNDAANVKSLPRKRVKSQRDITPTALSLLNDITGSDTGRRAIPIPIHLQSSGFDSPSTSSKTSSVAFSTLYLVPVIETEPIKVKFQKTHCLRNLGELLNEALNSSADLDVETRHFIERIDSWLGSQQQRSIDFLERLFTLKSVKSRFRTCVHNPAANPNYVKHCLQANFSQSTNSTPTLTPKKRLYVNTDLDQVVQKSNQTRVKMMQLDKIDKYLMNATFCIGVKPKSGSKFTSYFAQGLGFQRFLKLEDQKSPTEVWEQQFPLHKAAYDDDPVRIQLLLDQGHNPNVLDNDTWTPLHYAALYGLLRPAQVLMNHATTDVNMQNKKGETALHFAAMTGHHHFVELVLSNAKIDIDMKNDRGLTALDLCRDNPRAHWDDCAMLLGMYNPKNMELYFGEKASLHMYCGMKTTADELREKAFGELGLSKDCINLFAIWLVGPRLRLQLKGSQTVLTQLEKYPQYLDLWGEPIFSHDPAIDYNAPATVHFKRCAKATVKEEKSVVSKCPNVIEYLFAEVMSNFLEGFCPVKEDDYVFFAALIAMQRFGSGCTLEENMLPQILPLHVIPSARKHKHVLMKKINDTIKATPIGNTFTLQKHFMERCWVMRWYGCTYFKATMHMSQPRFGSVPVCVGINDYGLNVINMDTHKLVDVIKHDELDEVPQVTQTAINFNIRKGAFVFTISTPQVKHIENLIKYWHEKRIAAVQQRARHEENKKLEKAAKQSTSSFSFTPLLKRMNRSKRNSTTTLNSNYSQRSS
uniref:B41 domain-containing protein n=1 Tax=Panagrellus redivivus TaxID=6233 RepID=A0A7E4VQF7_PANRE